MMPPTLANSHEASPSAERSKSHADSLAAPGERKDAAQLRVLAALFLLTGVALVLSDLVPQWQAWLGAHFTLILGGAFLVLSLLLLVAARGPRRPKDDALDPVADLDPKQWLDAQIASYHDDADTYAWRYALCKIPALVFAGAVPVVAISADAGSVRWIVGILGALIVVLDGLQHVFKFRENWVSSVATREALEHERQRYRARARPYDGDDREAKLVENAIMLIANEYAGWASRQANSEEKPAGTTAAPTKEDVPKAQVNKAETAG